MAFVVVGEAAMGGEGVGFAEGAEEAVPPGDVAVVEAVQIELVVDGVVFGALEEVAHPVRSAQIAVVEILAEDGEDVVPGCACEGNAEEREHQGADDHGVRGDFQRVFVEGGQRFDAARAMVNLVTDAPEKVGIVASAMPPVEDEGSDKPADEAFQKRGHFACEMKERPPLKPVIPHDASQQNERDLAGVQKGRAEVPSGRFGKLTARKHPFQNEEKYCDCDDQGNLNHSIFPLDSVWTITERFRHWQNGGSAAGCGGRE